MAFKVQELMVNVMSGKAGMMVAWEDLSTCMTRTISCIDMSAFAARNPEVPHGRLAALRHQLRAARA